MHRIPGIGLLGKSDTWLSLYRGCWDEIGAVVTMKKQSNLRRALQLAVISFVMIFLIRGESIKSKDVLQAHYAKFPLSFETNCGQFPDSIKFMVHGGDNHLFLVQDGLILQSCKDKSASLEVKFARMNRQTLPKGEQEKQARSNYLIGNNRNKWLTNVPNFSRVQYKELYPGIDLVYYGNERNLEYDFIVNPGTQPQAIHLAFSDTVRTNIDSDGNLLVHGSEWYFKKPLAYQEADGQRVFLPVRYAETEKNQYTFVVPHYDPARPLIIDPIIVNFKFHLPLFFGPSDEDITGFCVDAEGNSYIAGTTSATDLYTKNPFQRWKSGLDTQKDAFVMKINASGTDVVYSTYLGGPGDDEAAGIAVDVQGCAYVAGATWSNDQDGYPFPTKNPLQVHHAGFIDAFIAKVNANGNDLIYSTYLGGGKHNVSFSGGNDKATGIAVDQQGNAYVIGQTISRDDPATTEIESFPWLNPIVDANDVNTVFNGAFLAKINAAGSALLFSTPLLTLGGTASGISLDADGDIYICGEAYQTTMLPVKDAFQASFQGGVADIFVEKIKTDGSAILYCSYLGGSKADEYPKIAANARGEFCVFGQTASDDFPSKNAIMPKYLGSDTYGWDCFITKFNLDASLNYSTYWGGSGADMPVAVAMDKQGNVWVAGNTYSKDLPVVQALDSDAGENSDAFISKLNPSGDKIIYSTYVGYPYTDESHALAVDPRGAAYYIAESYGSETWTKDASGQTGYTLIKLSDPQQQKIYQIWQQIRILGQFDPIKTYFAKVENWPAKVTRVTRDEITIRVPEDLINPRKNNGHFAETKLREVKVVVNLARSPGDTVLAAETDVWFQPPRPLLYDEVTRAYPPLVQGQLDNTETPATFQFIGYENDGQAGLRVFNSSAVFPPPLTLKIKIIAPDGELLDKNEAATFGNLINIGSQNAGLQFAVQQRGRYVIIVQADSASWGPFPAMFQIHLAANVGLPRKVVNEDSVEEARATRLDTYFNAPAPRWENLGNAAPLLGNYAETGLFKFANPLATSRNAIAVLIPPSGSPGGFTFGTFPWRARPPANAGALAAGVTDLSVPMAATPDAASPQPGRVIDLAQVPIPASAVAAGAPSGIASVLGEPDGNGVTLPMNGQAGAIISSIIMDLGSGNEIVDHDGMDLVIIGLQGLYAASASNTPFANTFLPLGNGNARTEFDLGATGLSCARYILISATGSAIIDAIESLHFLVDSIHPTIGPISSVTQATITMRRIKFLSMPIDPLIELIAPDGSSWGKDESGFGDDTDPDHSDAALINIDLKQAGFYRYLGRGYDTQPDEQAFGLYYTRLETGGQFDPVEIAVSHLAEKQTTAQKYGLIKSARQRDSYLFQAQPGITIGIAVNGIAVGQTPALEDPLLELYDPQDYLIAANDNYPGRGKNAALTITLPQGPYSMTNYPNPSTYRLVVSANDKKGSGMNAGNGMAFLRETAYGNYEVKVFQGAIGTTVERNNESAIPQYFALLQNFPNPFNPATEIRYQLPEQCPVNIRIYNTNGQQIRLLVEQTQIAGYYKINWDGKDQQGQNASSGVYFISMQAGKFRQTSKSLLLR